MIELYPLLLAGEPTAPTKAAPRRTLRPGHLCDDCHGLCQGGCEDYLSLRNQARHGCADHRACARRQVVNRLAPT